MASSAYCRVWGVMMLLIAMWASSEARPFFFNLFDTTALTNGTSLLENLLLEHAQHTADAFGQLGDLAGAFFTG